MAARSAWAPSCRSRSSRRRSASATVTSRARDERRSSLLRRRSSTVRRSSPSSSALCSTAATRRATRAERLVVAVVEVVGCRRRGARRARPTSVALHGERGDAHRAAVVVQRRQPRVDPPRTAHPGPPDHRRLVGVDVDRRARPARATPRQAAAQLPSHRHTSAAAGGARRAEALGQLLERVVDRDRAGEAPAELLEQLASRPPGVGQDASATTARSRRDAGTSGDGGDDAPAAADPRRVGRLGRRATGQHEDDEGVDRRRRPPSSAPTTSTPSRTCSRAPGRAPAAAPTADRDRRRPARPRRPAPPTPAEDPGQRTTTAPSSASQPTAATATAAAVAPNPTNARRRVTRPSAAAPARRVAVIRDRCARPARRRARRHRARRGSTAPQAVGVA